LTPSLLRFIVPFNRNMSAVPEYVVAHWLDPVIVICPPARTLIEPPPVEPPSEAEPPVAYITPLTSQGPPVEAEKPMVEVPDT
jgi:hypothetical protein